MLNMAYACHQCLAGLEGSGQEVAFQVIRAFNIEVEWNEENLYPHECDAGHLSYFRIQQHRFEILFEMALVAAARGFNREAVLNLYTALEDALRFYVEVWCSEQGFSEDEIQDFFGKYCARSEQQLGAFMLAASWPGQGASKGVADLYRAREGDLKAVRNAVVHKGTFVSRDALVRYGELVYGFVLALIDEVQVRFPQAVEGRVFSRLAQPLPASVPEGASIGTMSLPTAVSVFVDAERPATFLDAVERARSHDEVSTTLKGLAQLLRWAEGNLGLPEMEHVESIN